MENKPTLLCNVIITHPDQDHVNGITGLMKRYLIEGRIIITTAFYRKIEHSRCKFLAEFFSELEETHSPRGLSQVPIHSMISWKSPTEKCLLYAPHTWSTETCGTLFTRGTNQLWNKSSILTTVRTSYAPGYAAVMTGDSFGDIVLRTLNLNQKHVQIFQIPHHGSKKNIECGREGTVSRCVQLYSRFTADVYFISGSDKIHPHAEILSGILMAVYQNEASSSGRLVLTSSRGLSAEKIVKSELHNDRDYHTFLQRNMKIIHVDDVGIFCHEHKSRPFVTILTHPAAIDRRVLGGIVWTPETYYAEKDKIISES